MPQEQQLDPYADILSGLPKSGGPVPLKTDPYADILGSLPKPSQGRSITPSIAGPIREGLSEFPEVPKPEADEEAAPEQPTVFSAAPSPQKLPLPSQGRTVAPSIAGPIREELGNLPGSSPDEPAPEPEQPVNPLQAAVERRQATVAESKAKLQPGPKPIHALPGSMQPQKLPLPSQGKTVTPSIAGSIREGLSSFPEVPKPESIPQMHEQFQTADPDAAAAVSAALPGRQIYVSLPDHRLDVVERGKVIKSFPVAAGAPNTPTPSGQFRIIDVDPSPGVYTKWMGFYKGRTPTGAAPFGESTGWYGIHGAMGEPEKIGTDVSHGCIRMSDKDVQELYRMVGENTPVRIEGDTERLGTSSVPGTEKLGGVLPGPPAAPLPQGLAGKQAIQDARGRQQQKAADNKNKLIGQAQPGASPIPQYDPNKPPPRSFFDAADDQPSGPGYTGGPPMSLSDLVEIPKSLPEAGVMAAAALIPGGKIGKVAKGALRAGTTMLEGEGPQIVKGALTAENVLAEAANEGKKLSYAKFIKQNPNAGAEMFDLANAQPAMEGRPQLPRYEPPRGVSARMQDALANPAVRRQLDKMVDVGQKMMPESWYRTGPLYNIYQRVLGEDAAAPAFERLMENVAATSPQSRVPDNVRIASYYNYLDRQGLPIPDKPPTGYGSKAQQLHRQNALNIRAGGLDPLQNPKPASFTENLLGNENPVTIDTHNFRMIGMASKDPRFLATSAVLERKAPDGSTVKINIKPRQMYEQGKLTMQEALKNPTYWESAPAENEYGAYEKAQQGWAAKKDITPSTYQEKMWVGGGEKTGLGSAPEPFLRTVASRIHYTAERMGATPEEVLEAFVKGKIPLLSLLGGAAAYEGAGGGGQQQPEQQPNADGRRP